MAIVQHRQIGDAIAKQYAPFIDVSDFAGKSASEIEMVSLSRGLAALALAYLAGTDPKQSAAAVVDGFGDGGIDAVYFSQADNTLYILQSKWNTSHTGSVDQGSVLKFASGVKHLLSSRKSAFSGPISKRWHEIDTSIINARTVVLCVVYSGSSAFSQECKRSMDDLIEEIDETRELVDYQVIKQENLHNMLLQGAIGGPIIAPLTLMEWGTAGDSITAFYGQIAASDLADLHRKFGNRLFSRNIRSFLGEDTQVNSGIRQTLSKSPDLFWFLNNGVTALCDRIARRPAGGANRASAILDCTGLVIVNGAQTVGSISTELKQRDGSSTNLARVPIRLISLENAPEGFASLVTRTNNTQNRIDARNFVALDPEQERLRGEFAVDGIVYEYRQGEIENSSATRLGLVEATLSLACTHAQLELATQAKREIGKLWEDIARPPYKLLFNSGTTSEYVWERVTAFRRIELALQHEQLIRQEKSLQIVTHANRLIANIVYKSLVGKGQTENLASASDATVAEAVRYVADEISDIVEREYDNAYLAVLFKNGAKCSAIAFQFDIA